MKQVYYNGIQESLVKRPFKVISLISGQLNRKWKISQRNHLVICKQDVALGLLGLMLYILKSKHNWNSVNFITYRMETEAW